MKIQRNVKQSEILKETVNPKRYEPLKGKIDRKNYFLIISNEACKQKKINDTVWFLLKTRYQTLSKKVPTWASYGSLLSEKTPETAAMMLPVINGSATNGDNLCNALKEAEKLQESMYCNHQVYTFARNDGHKK